jgi:lysophospholipid acyltransferase (LPLAT)-like uncharacterized protein
VKKLLRAPRVRRVLATLMSFYLRLTVSTMRWRFENREAAEAVATAREGAVVCFWHGGIGLAVGGRKILKAKPQRALVSLSRDGEFVARIMESLGVLAVRGSAGRAHAKLAKGGAPAYAQAVEFLKEGGLLVVTPDGPQGPAQVMSKGPVRMARQAGVAGLAVGLAAKPALRLKNWDGTRVPLPFSRAWAVFDGPLAGPQGVGQAETEAVRAQWQARLRQVQARAEALLAGS